MFEGIIYNCIEGENST